MNKLLLRCNCFSETNGWLPTTFDHSTPWIPAHRQLSFSRRDRAVRSLCCRAHHEGQCYLLLSTRGSRTSVKFWPYSIDILAPERGVVNGLKPVFFTGWDQDTVDSSTIDSTKIVLIPSIKVRYEQFLFGSAGSQIEFGAQQCMALFRASRVNTHLMKAFSSEMILPETSYESKLVTLD